MLPRALKKQWKSRQRVQAYNAFQLLQSHSILPGIVPCKHPRL
jgi:hypothetical protein